MIYYYSIVFILSFAISAFGDGGTLHRTVLSPNDESVKWAFDFAVGVSEENSTHMRLERGEIVEGYKIFLYFVAQTSFFATKTKPHRLFFDANNDKTLQTTEEFVSETSKTSRYANERIYKNVELPLPFGSITPHVTVDLRCEQEGVRYNNAQQRLILFITQCKTVYEGILSIAGTDYPARLFFRSIQDLQDDPQTVVILDTNRDGVYHPIDDDWFDENWFAYINGKSWSVKTNFYGDDARVDLTPYDDPMGILHIKGDGVSRIALTPKSATRPAVYNIPNIESSLPHREEATYVLPVGDYYVTKIWLQPKDDDNVVYQWRRYSGRQGSSVDLHVEKDRSSSAHFGGPLRESFRMESKNVFGDVQIEYNGIYNDDRLEFIEMNRDDLIQVNETLMTPIVVKDERGQAVRICQPKYGRSRGFCEASVRMPFFANGPFTIQRLGSDNDLLKRARYEFVYRSKQPFVWGTFSFVVIFLGLFLYRIDREYPYSKWWVLAPAAAGMLYTSRFPNQTVFELMNFGSGPIVLSGTLIAWRSLSPKRLSHIFFLTFFTSLLLLVSYTESFAKKGAPHSDIVVLSGIVSLVLAVSFAAFQQIASRGRPGVIRWILAFFAGTLLPLLPIAVAAKYNGEYQIVLYPLIYLCTLTLPFFLLTALNPWVQYLLGRLMRDDKR